MEKEGANISHHHPGDPAHNNPARDRFTVSKPKRPHQFSRVAYVLQGGGSLGAYQMGVIKGLIEAGYEPDWIAATSIGSIQAAIIAGNPPEKQLPKLQEFWERVATYSPLDVWGEDRAHANIFNQGCSLLSSLNGQQDFFRPRWYPPFLPAVGTPDKVSIYDTSPLRQTLIDLIDFNRLNTCQTRLSLGSVNINDGEIRYFNNINYLIGPEHIMASSALPPGFPAVKINNEYYWDGGVHSNTPLEVLVDAKPREDTLCFVIDCFGGKPFVPTNSSEVAARTKDIRFSSHMTRLLKHYRERFYIKRELQKMAAKLNPEDLEALNKRMINYGGIDPLNFQIVHFRYKDRLDRGWAMDFNFSQVAIHKRADVGYQDAKIALAESQKWACNNQNLELGVYETPGHLFMMDDQ